MIVWMMCNCYIWPISVGDRIGTCGYCGERPHTYTDEPPSGKAQPRESSSTKTSL